MNDDYGELVSQFPHLLSITAPRLSMPLLTLVSYFHEHYQHVRMPHMLLLFRTGTIQLAKPSTKTQALPTPTFPTHMLHHLTSIMRMM